jgi:hypothetical protein
MNHFSRNTSVCSKHRRRKTGLYPVKFSLRDGVRRTVLRQDALVFGLHFFFVARAFGFHQNFDTRFIDIVTTAPAVVDTHHGF